MSSGPVLGAKREPFLILLLYELSSLAWAMAKPLLKIQRYFRRKPVRFFSLILLYLTAGSLVFLHSGIIGDNFPGTRGSRDSVVASELGGRTSSDIRGLGIMSRVTRRPARRFGPRWARKSGHEESMLRGGDYTSSWNRALKGRNAKDMEDGRGEINAARFCY